MKGDANRWLECLEDTSLLVAPYTACCTVHRLEIAHAAAEAALVGRGGGCGEEVRSESLG